MMPWQCAARRPTERAGAPKFRMTIDLSWPGIRLLGGYQENRARDNLVNDNFSVFLTKATTDDFRADGTEIKEARWFRWRELLQMCDRCHEPRSE